MATPALNPRGVSAPEKILQRLEFSTLRRLDGVLQGDYRTLFYGFGIDLADLRAKLGARPDGGAYVETVRGVGYRAARSAEPS